MSSTRGYDTLATSSEALDAASEPLMRHPTDHRQGLIFRSGAEATVVGVTDAGLVLDCPMPWLAGPAVQLLAQGNRLTRAGEDWLLHDGDTLAGILLGSSSATLEAQSLQLYRRLFALTRGLNLYRVWNFVPQINAVVAGTENYLAFNSGRHQAFTEQYGCIDPKDLSAASAVGIMSGSLTLAFTAGQGRVDHFENPLQVPSARYPRRYGKNAPLFSRGSKIHTADGNICWHLSGTASIRASETIGADFGRQLETTLENIERMLSVMVVPEARRAAWKVFLRDRRDLAFCRQRLAETYPGEVDQMMFVEADICRRDLLLEIEGIFHQLPPSTSHPNHPPA